MDELEQTVEVSVPDRHRRSRGLIAALATAGVVVAIAIAAGFYVLAPSDSAHSRTMSVATTTSPTTQNPNVMHGNPTKPIPPALAAEGCYTLHNGDSLPPGIVWAQPDTAFCPQGTGPTLGTEPPPPTDLSPAGAAR
jgi:hypothetical protein